MHAGGGNKVSLGQQSEFTTQSLPSNQRPKSTPGMNHQPRASSTTFNDFVSSCLIGMSVPSQLADRFPLVV
ncbi:hypothetical protein BCT81_06760 [Vibrio sp. 10N.261.52.A1]|nr:hypothetical protein BCT81_06760 [Vibrio sp. 10N.261.52.A1]